MSDTSELTSQQQDVSIWEGLNSFRRLPDWLAAPRDPMRVAAELERVLPEFTTEQLILLGCDLGHFRFKSDFWTGLYKLKVTAVGVEQPWVVALEGKVFSPFSYPDQPAIMEGILGSSDFHIYLPKLHLDLRAQQPETVLAALDMLTDPEQSRKFLTTSIRAGAPRYRELEIQASNPKVVRYKPGSRCTIVYHLEYPPHHTNHAGWPELVVAKTYRGEKGRNAYDSMAALWNSSLGSSSSVTIAEPLAYEPHLRALIQGPIYEDYTLKDLLERAILFDKPEDWAEADEMMQKTAVGLAELHQSGVNMGNLWTWEDELNEVIRWMDRLSDPLPGLGIAITPLIERLKALNAAKPADPVVPSHGSFRPAQVLIHKGNIGFIDFDSFGQSEPSLDLALFLSTVRNIGVTTSPSENEATIDNLNGYNSSPSLTRMNRLCDTFLDQYQRICPFSRSRLALWEIIDIFTYVIHCWTKIKTDEVASTMHLLDEYLMMSGIVRGA